MRSEHSRDEGKRLCGREVFMSSRDDHTGHKTGVWIEPESEQLISLSFFEGNMTKLVGQSKCLRKYVKRYVNITIPLLYNG